MNTRDNFSDLLPSYQSVVSDTLNLEKLLTHSVLKNKDPKIQTMNVLKEFNKNVRPGKNLFDFSTVMGERINQDEVMLGVRNNIPELVAFNEMKITINPLWAANPTINKAILGTHKQADPFYGAQGSHVLNVPTGKYGLAFTANNKPLIFAPGPHVIHDPNFSFDIEKGFVDQSKPYINHGTLHILRVPAAKIAKAWIGSQPVLLEARDEPYVFDNALFKMEKGLFENADERLITHGSLKRIIPHTGEVAITYNNGQLQTYAPSKNNKPLIIDSSLHQVTGFLDTSTQTLEFPSQEEQQKRKKENPHASEDEISLDSFSTCDGLNFFMQLVVTYEITDPMLALTNLKTEARIKQHIEACVTADMNKVMQQSTSQQFLNSSQTKATHAKELKDVVPLLMANDKQKSTQDLVRDQLAKDLKEYGIELGRLSIEKFKISDASISQEMAKQSLRSTAASAQEANLEKIYNIKIREAEQSASTEKIAQNQKNETIISGAEAELQAARKKAEAMIIQAEAEKQVKILMAQALQEEKRLMLDIKMQRREEKAAHYEKHPKAYDLKILKIQQKIQMEALLRNTQNSPPMPYLTQGMGMYNSPFPLFNTQTQIQAGRSLPAQAEVEETLTSNKNNKQ